MPIEKERKGIAAAAISLDLIAVERDPSSSCSMREIGDLYM